VHPGIALIDWLREQLHKYLPQAADLKMKDLPKRAVIYASSSKSGEITFDTWGEHADSAVHAAVRCSISIPYFFQPQMLDNRRVYDGGLLNNYPVDIFFRQEKERNPTASPPSSNCQLLWIASA
jgi:predicted acylesterase/phospholipase RssA